MIKRFIAMIGSERDRRSAAEPARSVEDRANILEMALNNMSHGLAMFDSDGRLLVANHRLAAIFMEDDGAFSEGTTIDALRTRLADGQAGSRNEPLTAAMAHAFRNARHGQQSVRLTDGTVVSVSRQKTNNGNVVIVFEDVTEQARAHDRIRQLAWTDELTGLMNRTSFQEVLRTSLDHLEGDKSLALHLIDLDHFKQINETLGHPIGDLLLIEAGKRIAMIAPDESHLARLGGDEFVVIQHLGHTGQTAEALAAQFVGAMAQPFEVSGHRINVGASVGVALAPRDGLTGDILLKRADMALYSAKARGRNNVTFFEDSLDVTARQRRELELDLRTAVAERQFTLAFQPIVDIESGDIASFETLIRWKHPARGFVSPAAFIRVAEETGLIADIGRWVLEQACNHAAKWPGAVSVAVNFSAVQFHDRHFPGFLADVLNRTGLPPGRLELEITETALLEDSADTRGMLEQFRALGVRISLDDFGTGYSSLSQLRTFPFNKIKIDGSFIRDLGRDASAVAVVRAVASIGRILEMAVVAECVESEEQLRFLAGAGCTEIQGFLLGRPADPERVPGLIAEHAPADVRRLLAA